MLEIKITPTSLVFNNLSDSLYEELSEKVNFDFTKNGYVIVGQPEELFKVLLHLSYTYDIELS